MKSIILYPENDRYVLKRIFRILNSRKLEADAGKINRSWSNQQLKALYAIMDNYTHAFVILSPEHLDDRWLTGILGYLSGSKKTCFFYFTEYDESNKLLFSGYNSGESYTDVETYAERESKRWSKLQKTEIARNNLITKGFALTDDAMGESIASGQLDILKDFNSAGFSCSARNGKGVPMISLAIRSKHLDIVGYLIEKGADINAISSDRNNTPIMDAASTGDLESVKLLVDEGADLECKSKDGQTALILAVGHGDVDVSNYLLSAGADYEVKDSLGMSAKSYANLFKNEEILKNML